MRPVRTMTFALIILAGSHFLGLLQAPAIQFLVLHLGFAGGLPWAVSTACGITGDRVVLCVLLAFLLLLVAPNGVTSLAVALVPVGAGLIAGNLIGIGIREESRGNSAPRRNPEEGA